MLLSLQRVTETFPSAPAVVDTAAGVKVGLVGEGGGGTDCFTTDSMYFADANLYTKPRYLQEVFSMYHQLRKKDL